MHINVIVKKKEEKQLTFPIFASCSLADEFINKVPQDRKICVLWLSQGSL